jgi:hypothetical protein
MSTEATPNTGFEQWCIVELYGHTMLAGLVREQTIAGAGFLVITIPAVDGQPAFTKIQSPSSIWALTPTDEETAMRVAAGLKAKPIELWRLQLPERQLTQGDYEDEDQFS